MATLRLRLWSSPEQVANVANRVASFCRDSGLPRECCFRLQVCVAEALNNIVKHGHLQRRDGPVRLVCRLGSHTVTVRIIDATPPLEALPGDALPEGDAEFGRGWPILHRWLDAVGYRRRNGLNYLYLRLDRPARS